MAKVRNISGFPEWLPEQRRLELDLISRIQRVYESYGFAPIETPAVELVETLQAKGVIDKELFAVKRLQDHTSDELELALHFDLTVPFARYVAQHLQELTFPFKRYQIQKVWRGDRPQKGRSREFYQADIDTVSREELPHTCEIEIVQAFTEALQSLEIGELKVRINNRKLVVGVLEFFEIQPEQRAEVLRSIDKYDKIGRDGVLQDLQRTVPNDTASRLLDMLLIEVPAHETEERLRSLPSGNPNLTKGKEEILGLLEALVPEVSSCMEFCSYLVRGLDYYTGLIVEAYYPEYPEFGSAGGGGRYDDLVAEYSPKKIPGVGASIGLTRLVELCFDKNIHPLPKQSPTTLLFALYDYEQYTELSALATQCRKKGVASEVFPKPLKLGKQIEYAEKKGIEFVLFQDPEKRTLQLKNLVSREQLEVGSIDEAVQRINA